MKEYDDRIRRTRGEGRELAGRRLEGDWLDVLCLSTTDRQTSNRRASNAQQATLAVIGVAQAARTMLWDHAQERRQFGAPVKIFRASPKIDRDVAIR